LIADFGAVSILLTIHLQHCFNGLACLHGGQAPQRLPIVGAEWDDRLKCLGKTVTKLKTVKI
jgi:hypothetical protein